MIKIINYLFISCFGIGSLRFATGTLASLATIIFLYFFFHIFKVSNIIIAIFLFLVLVVSFFAVSKYIDGKKNKDPKEVVIDEFIGQSIPIYFYEIAHNSLKNSQETILIYIYIFFLFRFFDIKKPFPVNFFDEKFKNSFGVIFDDVVAGLYVILTLVIFMIINSKFF